MRYNPGEKAYFIENRIVKEVLVEKYVYGRFIISFDNARITVSANRLYKSQEEAERKLNIGATASTKTVSSENTSYEYRLRFNGQLR